MRFLFIMDPMSTVHPLKDTTFDLILESRSLGIETFICHPRDLSARGSLVFMNAQEIHVWPPDLQGRFYSLSPASHYPASSFQIIWMRKDPPVDSLFLYTCMLLELAERQDCLVLNRPSSLCHVNEKMWTHHHASLMPQTCISSNVEELKNFIYEVGTGVVKPLSNAGGFGVMVFKHDDKNLSSALELLTQNGQHFALAQEYLPAVREGDKRVILVDGEAVAGLLRVPSERDNRANLHVGGHARLGTLNSIDLHIASQLGPHLRELGLFLVGIDIIGGKLTEVNVTSPTGIQEIDRLEGRTGTQKIRSLIISRAIEKLQTQ